MARDKVLTHGKKTRADALAREKRFDEARAAYESVCRADPTDAEAWMKLSAVHRRLADLDNAENCARAAVRLRPDLAHAHYTLAVALHARGKLMDALAGYRRAIQLKPDFALVHYLAGNALQAMGRCDEAFAEYRCAIELKPDLYEAFCESGAVLIKLDRIDEAITVLKRAEQLRPNDPAALINLANAAERTGRYNDALSLYRRALAAHPGSLEVTARLASLLERLGRIDEAAGLVAHAGPRTEQHPLMALAEARISRRQGRVSDAVRVLRSMIGQPLDDAVYGEICLLLGQCYDQLGDTAAAFPILVEGNRRLALAASPSEADARRYLDETEWLHRCVTSHLKEAGMRDDGPCDDAPVFIVGFPRSGTTLLEQVLDCHPALQTMEERPAAAAMERALRAWGVNRDNALANLAPDQLMHLRTLYWEQVDRHVVRRAGTLLVDKLPLNITRVALIWRVFPRARFILALRHPCDVCLSCFMQHFAVNDAMANFFTLEDTVRMYARVMARWQETVRLLPLDHRVTQYERLISDFEGETHALLDFLGVGWNSAVLDHTEHAARRDVINTPSYHQVTRPLYRDAAYRWRRYADQFEPLMPILQPFIEAFGYR